MKNIEKRKKKKDKHLSTSKEMTYSSCNPFKMGKLCVIFYLILIIINLLIILDNSSNYASAQSDLCFLADGSSSETFTINEAVPVGSIIGILKVSFLFTFDTFFSISFVFWIFLLLALLALNHFDKIRIR